MKKLLVMLTVFPTIFFVACQATSTTSPTGNLPSNSTTNTVNNKIMETKLDKSFTLKLDQSAHIEEGNFSITPREVLADSRCPVNVQCVWSGKIDVKLEIVDGSDQKTDIIATNIQSEAPRYKDFVVLLEHTQPGLLNDLGNRGELEQMFPNDRFTIKPEEYIFTFRITRTDSMTDQSALKNSGIVSERIIEEKNFRGVIMTGADFPSRKSFIPTKAEVADAEKILSACLSEKPVRSLSYADLKNYIRQYYGIVEGENDGITESEKKIISINAFHKDLEKKHPNWQEKFASSGALGYPENYFGVHIDLEAKTCSYYQ